MNIDPHLPINKTSAIVVAKHGEHQVSVKHNAYVTSLVPLPIKKFTGPRSEDLNGVMYGRIIVIGYSLWRSSVKDSKGRWVVKCNCGRYFILKGKTIKARKQHMCHECEYVHYARTGINYSGSQEAR